MSHQRMKLCGLFLFLSVMVLGSIFSGSLAAEAAKKSLTPLEQFLQYRSQYGKDTARADIKDNGIIDSSINSAEFISLEPKPVPTQETDSTSKLQINRDAPDTISQFSYHWEQNTDSTGSEYSSYINQPLQVTFVGDKISIPDDSASQKLLDRYGILLSNEGIIWQLEDSFALFEIMETIPQETRDYITEQKTVTSKWILTDKHIDNDIKITKTDAHLVVEISKDAFDSSIPRIAKIDNKLGKYFSQRLHHALIWFVTDGGTDMDAIERILNERYGVTTKVPSYEKLTQGTTNESKLSFQKFHPEELIEIINMFEEMPRGFHSIDGLNYLVRRADGTVHPMYPDAPAVGWPGVSPGYIEFMESAFTVDADYLHRLIIHEKSHFLWTKLFTAELKNDWIALGGWYKDKTASGWSTKKTTEFVSAYAHLKNPDEDMAESIAYFVIDPDKLRSRSLQKYEFIRDRIMEGNIYISTVREDLTFEVLNLYPDYIYPGKIIRVDITISGDKFEDKKATIEIELSSKSRFEGAKSAYLRLISEIGTYKDVTLKPINGNLGHVLRGEITIDKNAKGGLWQPNQIRLVGQTDDERFENQNNFGWKFFVNNIAEDTTPPLYTKNSVKLALRTDYSSYQRPVQILSANWNVIETQGIKNCYAAIDDDDPASYSFGAYGEFDARTNNCNVEFKITEYFRSGHYSARQLKMTDNAGNEGTADITKLTGGSSIFVRTANPDTEVPYLDVNDIRVSATPTNPTEPNGETNVKIVYFAKDDKSGLGQVSYILRDPQGIQHYFYHYHKNFHGLFFNGNPNELLRYDVNLILPEGSAPGKWALIQMKLDDKANNSKSYEFTEIMHFEVI